MEFCHSLLPATPQGRSGKDPAMAAKRSTTTTTSTSREIVRLVKYAIRSWGPTLRLMVIMLMAAACWMMIH